MLLGDKWEHYFSIPFNIRNQILDSQGNGNYLSLNLPAHSQKTNSK